MQCYTELLPPTGATASLSLPFTSSTANNLIVAKTSLLQIFALKSIENEAQTKLVLISEYHVAGTITTLSRVKILNSRSGGEAILIAVRDAKLSLIEWDPELYSISTTSIHYYETEELHKNPWAPHISQCATHLTVDPSSRCAAFNFGGQNLAILPFHQHGDDLVMDEYDAEMDREKSEGSKLLNGDAESYSTPYAASFVLSLTTIDPSILHPIDLAFLYEYREPTFGILYTTSARSQALSSERKDVTFYAVFTLDLEQKASTTLLSISKLPNDLYKVVPLPPPVGGALLIGSNELVHVEQGGKTNAIGVNEFARQSSTFSMADNSSLNLKLEGSQVVSFGPSSTELLLILSTGQFLLLSFQLDGRTVSGVHLQPLPTESSVISAAASCTSFVGPGQAFIGSEEADSVLFSWSKSAVHLRRQSSKPALRTSTTAGADGINGVEEEDDLEDEDDFDDDLYGPQGGDQVQRTRSLDAGVHQNLVFKIHDRLQNIGPIRDSVFGSADPPSDLAGENKVNSISKLELVVASGSGNAGSVTVLQRELEVKALTSMKLQGANGIWSVRTRDQNHQGNSDESTDVDEFLIASAIDAAGEEYSNLYRITSEGIRDMENTEFETSAGGTLAAGSIANGTRVVQVLKGELRSYDSAFGLSQIHPIVDEDTGALARVVSASFADPYVLIIRDDSTIVLLQADKSGDLEECDMPDELTQAKWLSGWLYNDQHGVFGGGIILALMSLDGGLQIFLTSDLATPIFRDAGLHYLPARLNANPQPKHWRQAATITELIITDLGDSTSTDPYMFVRTSTDDLAIYQPYRQLDDSTGNGNPRLAFIKVPNHLVAKSPVEAAEDADEADTAKTNKPLTPVAGPDGLRMVFMPGPSPSVIVKRSSSLPQAYHLHTKSLRALTSYNTEDCRHFF